MRIEIHRWDATRREDFDRLHSPANGCGWCQCVAWWVPTWDGWGERTAEENRRLRDELCARGEYDGYLLYIDGVPAAWCQVGPRDRLDKLRRQLDLEPDPDAWAVSCFLVAPAWRGKGVAARLLAAVLEDLAARGATRVEAFPKRAERLEVDDLWNGPERMYLAAGFEVVKDHPARPVLSRRL